MKWMNGQERIFTVRVWSSFCAFLVRKNEWNKNIYVQVREREGSGLSFWQWTRHHSPERRLELGKAQPVCVCDRPLDFFCWYGNGIKSNPAEECCTATSNTLVLYLYLHVNIATSSSWAWQWGCFVLFPVFSSQFEFKVHKMNYNLNFIQIW